MESKINLTPPFLPASPSSDAPVRSSIISGDHSLSTMENPTHIQSKIDPTPPLLPSSPSSDAPIPPSITTNPPLRPATDASNTSLADPPNTSQEQGEPYLSLSINSLGFAGMLLVKSEDELERVIRIGIGQILKSVRRRPLIVIPDGRRVGDTVMFPLNWHDRRLLSECSLYSGSFYETLHCGLAREEEYKVQANR